MTRNQEPASHCMVVHAYYPLGETRVEREALALVAKGYQVDILCLRDEDELKVEVVDGITVHRLPVHRSKRKKIAVQLLEYMAFFWLVFFKLASLQWRQNYRVVQVHNLPDFLIFAALIPKLMGARLIIDLHDLMPEFYASRFGTDLSSWPVRLIMWQERISCRFADHVITVSDHWRQLLISRGVPAEKCTVVMNVADDNIFNLSAGIATGVNKKERFRLIYHGTIVHRYGLDLAVQAVARLKRDIPNIELVILGKGDYVDALIRTVEELDLSNYVTIFNELRPAHQLPELIRTADLGIVPYRNDTFTDGLLPTKLMEYAALGLPSVAARTTAIEHCFGKTMVAFFEPGDLDGLVQVIKELHDSPQVVAELAQGSRKFNERYSWDKVGSDYTNLVKHLAGEQLMVSNSV